jgi:hypothetical protein
LRSAEVITIITSGAARTVSDSIIQIGLLHLLTQNNMSKAGFGGSHNSPIQMQPPCCVRQAHQLKGTCGCCVLVEDACCSDRLRRQKLTKSSGRK